MDDNAAGTITFSGATKTISSTTAAGVSLSDNAGATINFTNGGLVIKTTSGNGFSATGPGPAATTGGTVTVQGTGNTHYVHHRHGAQRRQHDDRRQRC